MLLNPNGWLESTNEDFHHVHLNKDALDKIAVDVNGKLVFGNEQIDTTTEWEIFEI